MAKSLCRLVILVNHALVTNFDVANMSFNAIRKNKVLAKISGFTVKPQITFQAKIVILLQKTSIASNLKFTGFFFIH